MSIWEFLLCSVGGMGILIHMVSRLVPAGDPPKHDDHDSDGDGDDEEEDHGDDGHGDDGHGGGHV